MALLAATPAVAGPLDGRWSNVCLSRQTGDQGGMQLVLTSSGTAAAVGLKVCEGGCWAMPTRNVVLRKDRIAFTAEDRSYDAEGRLAESRDLRFEGQFAGATLKLSSAGFWEAQTLKRQRSDPAGAAAETLEDWPGPTRVCR